MLKPLVFIACLIKCCICKHSEDEHPERVHSLPEIGTLEDSLFSGYITISESAPHKSIHYLLVESKSNPETDPLIIWFNGGPGCSSMYGFFLEIGPYQIKNDPDDHSKKLFRKNEHSWNREASLLIIEQPAGVGFSTCHGGSYWECESSD